MNKLQEIYEIKDNENYERIVFISDTPVFGVIKEQNTVIRGLFNTKELLQLMKNSIPAENLKGIGWGKKVEYENEDFKFSVEFTTDKIIRIEVVKLKSNKVGQEQLEVKKRIIEPEEKLKAPEVKQEAVEEVDPEIIDELLEAEALLYYDSETEPKDLVITISDAGYKTKVSNNVAAVKQAINYKTYPLLVMLIKKDISADPVLVELKSMHMDVRREQFTLLVSNNLKTGDIEHAFSYSVSMVLDCKDLSEFETLFSKTSNSLKRNNSSFIDIIQNKS